MRFGRIVAALLGAIGILVAPATAAQASTTPTATSACAPTDQARWLGTFTGPHVNEANGGGVFTKELMVYQTADGQLWMRYDGDFWGYAHAWGDTATGLLRNAEPNHPIMGVDTTSATCDADGDVVGFSGDWYHFYNWPDCWGCAVGGTFDVTRV